MNNLFVYIAKRDKQGIKLLWNTNIDKEVSPMRLENFNLLGFNNDFQLEIQKVIKKNKMNWDVWIETAANYQELRNSLISRGYKSVPGFHTPKLSQIKKIKEMNIGGINKAIGKLKPIRKMIQRNKTTLS